MTRRICLLVGAFAIALIGFCVATVLLDPKRGSPLETRTYVLRETPLDTSFDDVLAMAREHHWKDVRILKHGAYKESGTELRPVDIKMIRAELSDYQGTRWATFAHVWWTFDERGRLTHVWVWKPEGTSCA